MMEVGEGGKEGGRKEGRLRRKKNYVVEMCSGSVDHPSFDKTCSRSTRESKSELSKQRGAIKTT